MAQRVLADHGGERGAGGIAANHEPCRVDAERWPHCARRIRSRRWRPRWPPEICAPARDDSRPRSAGSRWLPSSAAATRSWVSMLPATMPPPWKKMKPGAARVVALPARRGDRRMSPPGPGSVPSVASRSSHRRGRTASAWPATGGARSRSAVARSAGAAAAIMVSKRLARGSSGMTGPVNHESLPWRSIRRESGRCRRLMMKSLRNPDKDARHRTAAAGIGQHGPYHQTRQLFADLDVLRRAMARGQRADHGTAHACGLARLDRVRRRARLRGRRARSRPPLRAGQLVRDQFPAEAGGRHRDLDRSGARRHRALCGRMPNSISARCIGHSMAAAAACCSTPTPPTGACASTKRRCRSRRATRSRCRRSAVRPWRPRRSMPRRPASIPTIRAR